MTSLCNCMDYPEWTSEQRVAVMRVEVMLMQRRVKHYPSTLSTPATAPALPPAAIPLRAVAGTLISEVA